MCRTFGLVLGSAMDLQNGRDFDLLEHRNRAVKQLLTEKPKLPMGSPPCTYLSIPQELNKWLHKDSQEWMDRFEVNRLRAIRHIACCCKLFENYIRAGNYCLHEHPWTARSWELEAMKDILADPRVKKAKTHMCQFGMTSRQGVVGSEDGPVKKPAGFADNSQRMLTELF